MTSLSFPEGSFEAGAWIHPDASTDGIRQVDIGTRGSVDTDARLEAKGRLRGSGKAEGTGEMAGPRDLDDGLICSSMAGPGEGISGIG